MASTTRLAVLQAGVAYAAVAAGTVLAFPAASEAGFTGIYATTSCSSCRSRRSGCSSPGAVPGVRYAGAQAPPLHHQQVTSVAPSMRPRGSVYASASGSTSGAADMSAATTPVTPTILPFFLYRSTLANRSPSVSSGISVM
jgi:hypothetical protein